MKPVTPKQLSENLHLNEDMKKIVEIVNELLSQKFRGGYVTLNQNEIVDSFLKKNPTLSKDYIIDNNLLDFESFYQDYGWNVSYDKPAYNESHFEPYYTFTPKTITTLYG